MPCRPYKNLDLLSELEAMKPGDLIIWDYVSSSRIHTITRNIKHYAKFRTFSDSYRGGGLKTFIVRVV